MQAPAFKRTKLRELARNRVGTAPPKDYRQPEAFHGFDFTEWVSPYTKTFGNVDAKIMVILQDWCSADLLEALSGERLDLVRNLGYAPWLRTNKRLKSLLWDHLQLRPVDVYATNALPFIKSGLMSNDIPTGQYVEWANQFTIQEIDIVRPQLILTLGKQPLRALKPHMPSFMPRVVELPHPAARISQEAMRQAWAKISDVP